jgi:dynein heavy chain 2
VLGISDTSWNSMKKFLGNRKVKEQILSFDARSLTGPIRKQVQKIMQVSSLPRMPYACTHMCAW